MQAFYAWHEDVVMSYKDGVAARTHVQRTQRLVVLAWQEQAVLVRQQINSLQAAMLRWSQSSLAAAFSAWVDYAADQAGLPIGQAFLHASCVD